MAELMMAQFHDEPICIFDIVDSDGHYIEDVRSVYRKASQSGELLCPECGGRLELCAGAVVAPYFRHHTLGDCVITREMSTEAGKRKFIIRKFLYSMAKAHNMQNIIVCEQREKWSCVPIIFDDNEQKTAFLYLDGKSRIYEQLKGAADYYKNEKIHTVWFLNKKFQSNSMNITSDEAEVSRLNELFICKIKMKILKKYPPFLR